METLITDPQQAKAELEIDMNSPASKQDVATYVQNALNAQLRPIVQQMNMQAQVLNLFMDFLSHRGVKKGKHGDQSRYFFSTAEWNEYLLERKRAAEAAEQLKDKPATKPN